MPNKLPIPPVTQSEIIYNEFFKIRRDCLQLNENEDYYYYTLITKPIDVMVLATTKEGLYLINREYRHPSGHILLSCPGGIKNENETILECAKRELLEETGFEAKNFEIIGSAFPFPGITGQRTVYVRAKNAIRLSAAALEAAEVLETDLLSEDDIKTLILSGSEVDGLLCTALFFNQLKAV